MVTLRKVTTETYFLLASLFIALSFYVFNQRLATAYTVIIFTSFIWYHFDNKRTIPFEKSVEGRKASVIVALLAIVVFLAASQVAIKYISPASRLGQGFFTSAAMVQSLSSVIPPLTYSFISDFIGYVIIAVLVETSFFFGQLPDKLPDLFKDLFGVNIHQRSLLLGVFIASFFTLFHFVTKEFKSALLAGTFVFGLISYWLVRRYGHLREAYLLHFFVNGAAVVVKHLSARGGA